MSIPTTLDRQPAGRPTGGQFAFRQRDADNVTLDDLRDRGWAPLYEVTSPDEVKTSAEMRELYTSAERAEQRDADRALLESAIQLARKQAMKRGLSREQTDDIAQETLLSVLESRRARVKAAGNAADQSKVSDADRRGVVTGALVQVASRALVSREMDTHRRHEDSKAFAMWKKFVSEDEARLGRNLTRTELDDIATFIRDNWHNPRHKPAEGFQHETKVVSAEALGEAFESALVDDGATKSGKSAQHDLADRIEDGLTTRQDARKALWNTIADENTPHAAKNAIKGTSRVRSIRNAVPDAVAVADRILDGSASDAEIAAFMAPFELAPEQTTPSARDVHRVAHTIANRPAVGHRLWLAAVEFATGPSEAKVVNP